MAPDRQHHVIDLLSDDEHDTVIQYLYNGANVHKSSMPPPDGVDVIALDQDDDLPPRKGAAPTRGFDGGDDADGFVAQGRATAKKSKKNIGAGASDPRLAKPSAWQAPPSASKTRPFNPYRKSPPPPPSAASTAASPSPLLNPEASSGLTKNSAVKAYRKRALPTRSSSFTSSATGRIRSLQAGLVLEEDVSLESQPLPGASDPTNNASSFVRCQTDTARPTPALLYHDPDFKPVPSSIDGEHRSGARPKCRCSPPRLAELAYSRRDGPNFGEPYYMCGRGRGGGRGCGFFVWACRAERMRWHRFGPHSGHVLVGPGGFRAEDLVQGKVGDCWFLSALAVVAERSDLMGRLFAMAGSEGGKRTVGGLSGRGIVEATLFVDGFWRRVVMDDFLPCIIDGSEEEEMDWAITASLGGFGGGGGVTDSDGKVGSSRYDPRALSDDNWSVLCETAEFLQQDRARKDPTFSGRSACPPRRALSRPIASADLAYSKARGDQLWVPFLEKAYAKTHGSYKSISGGHIAEAFLDLTGAPTVIYDFDSPDFDPRAFWMKLMEHRRRRLPMGCATSRSQAGIVGMHAYSILDVREVTGVGIDFFESKITEGTLGNVSGFTEFDGTVRLLRIRNPHGKGEWKGEFSDRSAIWERLFESRRGGVGVDGGGDALGLRRSMKDDGTFWIDYDSFLMGFTNVDVVLAFENMCAKSFGTNFPEKKDNQRCTRAFELSLVEEQPGMLSRDAVEVYVMAIQKSRRGASHGRADRKKSYKMCDVGILVGERRRRRVDVFDEDDEGTDGDDVEFDQVEGKMFGFRRNGHCRIVLDRRRDRSLVVMPVSFGHPAATDVERSFVLRFVSDASVLIRELRSVPRMDVMLRRYCFDSSGPCSLDSGATRHGKRQRSRHLLMDDPEGRNVHGEPLFQVLKVDCLGESGGTAFVYLCINDAALKRARQLNFRLSLRVEANCRGMVCRTEDGLLQHETVAKGKKFEAAWRRYSADFLAMEQSRLLMVLVQSGQDTELGEIKCERIGSLKGEEKAPRLVSTFFNASPSFSSSTGKMKSELVGYWKHGIFAASVLQKLPDFSSGCDTIINLNADSDLGLEHVLAQSREEVELQRALEESEQLAAASTSGDLELQKALAKSRVEYSRSSLFASIDEAPEKCDKCFDTAIAASLEASEAPQAHVFGNNSAAGRVGLAANASLGSHRRPSKSSATVVVNLSETSVNEVAHATADDTIRNGKRMK